MTNTGNPAASRRLPLIGPVSAAGLTVALLSGCAGGGGTSHVVSVSAGSPSAVQSSADRGSQATRYRDCLLSNGVTLLDQSTAEGMPQIDKERTNIGVVNAASQRCRPYLPAAVDAERPDQQAVEAQRRLAVCLRGHGVPEYPDPDPVTGDPRVSDQLAARLKDDPSLASGLQTCQQQVWPATGGGTIGG
ncbi:hypothetical protein [Frankia sp. Cr1]|uniref:hypothetical protein n=1 Tax=Frankia sp. Cr1 TaxID=3073931 RepID=UPI002AD307BC|nr:hypothetical protein [Frankia sp. Cr1]